MKNSTFIETYLLTLFVCLILTVGLILLIKKGLKKYFENLSQDPEISKFFIKMTNLIILLGGLSAGLTRSYNTGTDANWLTLTWNVTGQLNESLERLFITMIIFAITFFILHLVARRISK